MKWTKRSVLEFFAVLAMTAVVLTLAILQYKWAKAISTVEQARLEGALDASVKNFNQEFSYDFDRLCESFEVSPVTPVSPAEDLVVSRYATWIKTTSRSDFVSGVYVWKSRGDRQPTFESLDLDSRLFQQAPWPAHLMPLQESISRQAARLASPIAEREAEDYPWTFQEGLPALIRPIFERLTEVAPADKNVQLAGFLIIDLNGSFLRRVYLPELADRHFGQMDFEMAIRNAKAPYEALFLSSTDFPIATTSPDAAVNLLDSVTEEARRRGHPVMQSSNMERQWQLVVRHPSGSLGAAVGSLRKKIWRSASDSFRCWRAA